MPGLRTAPEILRYFSDWDLDADQRWYLPYNVRRFEVLLATVDEVLPANGAQRRVLDIGAGFQTELIRGSRPDLAVDTLGFSHPSFPPRDGERHLPFDLNDSNDPSRWPKRVPYPLVVMAEVVEHLYTSAEAALRFVAGFLGEDGRLLLQTPNAVALHKRLRMALGRHPYGPISDDRKNPLHFREYTVRELEAAAGAAGLVVERLDLHNYFDAGGAGGRAYVAMGRVLPPALRHGITAVLRARAPG